MWKFVNEYIYLFFILLSYRGKRLNERNRKCKFKEKKVKIIKIVSI